MFSNELEFNWEVSYALVLNKTITQLNSEKQLKNSPEFRSTYKPYKYNVFSKERLYEVFARINVENLNSIEDFVNQYGLLGLYIENRIEDQQELIEGYENIIKKAMVENDISLLKTFYDIKEACKLAKKLLNTEKTSDFIREVKLMRGILELNSFKQIKVVDIENIKSKIHQVADLAYIDYKYVGDENIPDFKLLEHAIKGLISSIINIKMKNVKRSLKIKYDIRKKTFVYIETWIPKSLLGCLYTMLCTDLSHGRKTEICLHCQYPFVVMDDRDTKYCSDECRRNANTKRTRERMSNAKQLKREGFSLDEIYRILNNQSKKEIKLEKIKKWIGIE